ncbi:protein GPR108 isoform X1 [Acanthochromis polyacanthus]|uniref:protein GPR108 isoform X1 n=2 Tax=Acanthochromis polyacanthus TaxID=80966 RepID=UPI0022340757|nr:protein GPR108 isoform X1 [Acanthochromis polyacanthus]
MAVAQRSCFWVGFLLLMLLCGGKARKHKLTLKNETRSVVDLNNFGFYADGTLDVNLHSLRIPSQRRNSSTPPVGFSLSRSRVNGVLSYTAEETETCPLSSPKSTNDEPLIVFIFNFEGLSVSMKATGNQDNILTAKLKAKATTDERKARGIPDADAQNKPKDDVNKKPDDMKPDEQPKPDSKKEDPAGQNEGDKTEEKKPDPGVETKEVEGNAFDLDKQPEQTLALDQVNGTYNFSFHIKIGPKDQGLYSLRFHYCQSKFPAVKQPYSFTVDVQEKNPGGYLSAAEIPLSRLYICMAGVFFTAAMVWVYTLMKHRYSVFKIHWLMAALAFTKSTSLVFHSINYHFINTEGHPIEGWAVMYYITHLLKGALLFITLALIGTGWAFVKYILSDKEKKIFMIVIPLQVLANVAYIIIESTEEGSSEYYLWKEILFLVDLICCGAILFPVVWSIRHLQEASSTDGKGETLDQLQDDQPQDFLSWKFIGRCGVFLSAAMNLEKLKLFRHYYVMIVCYIYFTRIIAILLKITMPFQWQWCYEFLVELSTLIFFVLTGYKFRPASNNPYLQLPQDEEDVEMDEVVTESGALEGISKVKKTSNGRERQKESTL